MYAVHNTRRATLSVLPSEPCEASRAHAPISRVRRPGARHHLIQLVTLERCECPSDSSAIICNCMEGSVFGSVQADIKVSGDQDIHSVRRQSTCHTYKSPRHGRLFYLECLRPPPSHGRPDNVDRAETHQTDVSKRAAVVNVAVNDVFVYKCTHIRFPPNTIL